MTSIVKNFIIFLLVHSSLSFLIQDFLLVWVDQPDAFVFRTWVIVGSFFRCWTNFRKKAIVYYYFSPFFAGFQMLVKDTNLCQAQFSLIAKQCGQNKFFYLMQKMMWGTFENVVISTNLISAKILWLNLLFTKC